MADGTPRDCVVNACGAQADTAIIRDLDIANGEATPLGKTQGYGPVNSTSVISAFMGKGQAPTNKGAASSAGVEDDLSGLEAATKKQQQRRQEYRRQMDNLFNLPGLGVAGIGGQRNTYPVEKMVGDMTGQGATRGLPTSDDQGMVSVVYRQVRAACIF